MVQRRTRSSFGKLGLDEKPGLAVPNDKEIDFPRHLVTKTPEFEGAESEIGPALDCFQEMRGDHGLEALTFVGDEGPVPQKPR